MQTTFRSKIGLGILLPILLLLVAIEVLMIVNRFWTGASITGFVILLIAYLYIDTAYIITVDKKLRIKSGFLINKLIDIGTIKNIRATKDPIASPALSLDRIEIEYNQNESIIISPKEKDKFINHLKRLNPEIKMV
jgi:hypothetical protein